MNARSMSGRGRWCRALKAHSVPGPPRNVRSMGYVLGAADADDYRIAS